MTVFTQRQFYKMCDLNLSHPVALHEADLSRPFVYDRVWGVFYCPSGWHQGAMSLLLAWHHGCDSGVDVARKLGLKFSCGTADQWLESVPGTAFRSSVGKHVVAGHPAALNAVERRWLGPLQYVASAPA